MVYTCNSEGQEKTKYGEELRLSILNHIFANVPFENGQPKYIPLVQLPVGTELMITTRDVVHPIDTSEIPDVNGEPEKDIVFLPAGTHYLRVLEWEMIYFSPEEGEKRSVKPIYTRMSITSPFMANFDEDSITYRLQSGSITKIQCGPFKIDIRLLEDSTTKHRTRKSRRHGPRGKYRPLRKRRFQ